MKLARRESSALKLIEEPWKNTHTHPHTPIHAGIIEHSYSSDLISYIKGSLPKHIVSIRRPKPALIGRGSEESPRGQAWPGCGFETATFWDEFQRKDQRAGDSLAWSCCFFKSIPSIPSTTKGIEGIEGIL